MIIARGLRKEYGPPVAVHGLDLDVEPGEVVGLLGPNGAGKTTTLQMLCTLLRPTAGSATVAGADLRSDPAGVRRRIGYVPQSGNTDPTCPLGQELELQGRLHGLSRAEARRRVVELTEELGVEPDRPSGRLSGGQRRRLDLALGLVHRPPLVLLDEPTVGLDPRARTALWEQVRRINEAGTTVVLTTHYLEEAEACCTRLVMVNAGRVVADGTPQALKGDATIEQTFLALT